MSNIRGECKVCHFIFDPSLGSCPACQDKARGDAYGTAWGTLSTATYHSTDRKGPYHTCVDWPTLPCSGCDYAEEQSRKPETFWDAMEYYRGLRAQEGDVYPGRLSTPTARGNTPAEDREEFRIPMGDAAQIYELKRMFRL